MAKNTVDAVYRAMKDEILLSVQTPRAAQWVARYLTSNVASTIYYSTSRGRDVVAKMIEDGLVVEEDTVRT